MKKSILIICALCLGFNIFAQSKIETFDENKWNWTEGVSKYSSVVIDNGQMEIKYLKINKKSSEWSNIPKTFAKLPVNINEPFSVKIKIIVSKNSLYSIIFNASMDCLDEGNGNNFSSNGILFNDNQYILSGINADVTSDKLPLKIMKDFLLEILISYNGNKTSIEVNNMQIYNGNLKMTGPCLGFINMQKTPIIIDEVEVIQNLDD